MGKRRKDAVQQAAETHLRFPSTSFDCYHFLAWPFSVTIVLRGGIEMHRPDRGGGNSWVTCTLYYAITHYYANYYAETL